MNPHNFYVTQNDLANKWKRFANFIIDYIVFYTLFLGISIIGGIIFGLNGGDVESLATDLENVNPLLDRLITLILYVIYFIIIETTLKGRSIGKFLTKTQVVLKDGSKPTINEITIRSLCRAIPFDHFSFLGADGKGWHDSLSKTYVVNVDGFEERKIMSKDLEDIGKIEEN